MSRAGYDEAIRAITEGRAEPRALWVLVKDERTRDGYALKPDPWEGSGEYQHVEIDGRSRLIRLPDNAKSLIKLAKQRRVTDRNETIDDGSTDPSGDLEIYRKLRQKLARVHPSNQSPNLPLRIELTYGEIARLSTAILKQR